MRSCHILMIVLSLSVTACSFRKDDAKQNESAKATAEVLTTFQKNQDEQKQSEEDGGKLTDENVAVKFIENEQPGSYQMRVTWPASVVTMAVQIGDEFETKTVKTNFFEKAVLSNNEYKIRLYSKNSSGLEVDRKELVLRAPMDVVIDGDVQLKSIATIESNRFYIKGGAKIVTNGYNLSIKTKKLYIRNNAASPIDGKLWDDFSILTTPPNTLAQSPVQLEGSKITITADEAHGHLKVALIGLNGQNGRNGDELDQEKGFLRILDANLNGANGQPGEVFKDTVPCPSRRGAEGSCQRTVLSCLKAPTNGLDGRQGQVGTPGENGQRGGNTGSFFIDVRRPGDFKVEVGQLVGKPGRGGVGGAGSPGGLPGQAGKNPGHPCPSAQNGQNGPQGSQGANGATGADGKLGTIETGSIPATVFAL